MRKRSDNAVEHFAVMAVQRFLQPAEQSNFFRIEHPAVQVEPFRNSDAAMTALDGFNRIGAGQHHNVAANCPGADVKLMCQIAISIMPPETQSLQNLLAGFPWGQVPFLKTPFGKIDDLSFLLFLLVLSFMSQTVSGFA